MGIFNKIGDSVERIKIINALDTTFKDLYVSGSFPYLIRFSNILRIGKVYIRATVQNDVYVSEKELNDIGKRIMSNPENVRAMYATGFDKLQIVGKNNKQGIEWKIEDPSTSVIDSFVQFAVESAKKEEDNAALKREGNNRNATVKDIVTSTENASQNDEWSPWLVIAIMGLIAIFIFIMIEYSDYKNGQQTESYRTKADSAALAATADSLAKTIANKDYYDTNIHNNSIRDNTSPQTTESAYRIKDFGIIETINGKTKYINERFQFCFVYPENFLSPLGQSDNMDGQIFIVPETDSTSFLKVSVYGSNLMQWSAYMEVGAWYENELNEIKKTEGAKIYYKTLRNNWFVISWDVNGSSYYKKCVLEDNKEKTILIECAADKATSFSQVIFNLTKKFPRCDF